MILQQASDAPAFYRVLLSCAIGRVPDLSPSIDVETVLAGLPRLYRVPPDLRLAFDMAMVDLYIAECDVTVTDRGSSS